MKRLDAAWALGGLIFSMCAETSWAQSNNVAWTFCARNSEGYTAQAIIGECTSIIERGSASATDISRAYNSRGVAYYMQGDLINALLDYERAISANPENEKPHYNMGLLYWSQDNLPFAEQAFTDAIALSPNNVLAFQARSHVLSSLDEHRRAISDADAAAALDPANAQYHNLRCWNRAVAGVELEIARQACDRAIALSNNPEQRSSFLDSRGLIGLKEGRYQEAYSDYDAAVAEDNENAHALFGRSVAEARLGDSQAAHSDLARAIELAPNIAHDYIRYGIEQQ